MTDISSVSPTGAAWTKYAEQYVPKFATEHPDITSADALYSYMRETGNYIPREYVRNQWREEKRVGEYSSILQRLGDNEVVDRDWFRETSFEYREKYIWKVEIEGRLAETGERVTRTVTVESEDNLSVGEIYDQAADYAERYLYDFFTEVPSFSLTSALHKGAEGW